MPEDREPCALFGAQAADRQLSKLPQEIPDRLDIAIDALADNPKLPGSTKLQGYVNSWRVRVGEYRVIYKLDETAREITVTRVAHRREAYR